jgi:hypothetical protein
MILFHARAHHLWVNEKIKKLKNEIIKKMRLKAHNDVIMMVICFTRFHGKSENNFS